jgi:hypothetical protein
LIRVDLAKELAKYLTWEPKVGDLTIVYGDTGEEIIEPIILRHEKEKKIVLSLREVGDLVWLPRLSMLLYELKMRSANGFSLNYEKDTDQWTYADDKNETSANSPEDAAALALLNMLEKKDPEKNI